MSAPHDLNLMGKKHKMVCVRNAKVLFDAKKSVRVWIAIEFWIIFVFEFKNIFFIYWWRSNNIRWWVLRINQMLLLLNQSYDPNNFHLIWLHHVFVFSLVVQLVYPMILQSIHNNPIPLAIQQFPLLHSRLGNLHIHSTRIIML